MKKGSKKRRDARDRVRSANGIFANASSSANPHPPPPAAPPPDAPGAMHAQSELRRRPRPRAEPFVGDGLRIAFTRQGDTDGIFHVLDGDRFACGMRSEAVYRARICGICRRAQLNADGPVSMPGVRS